MAFLLRPGIRAHLAVANPIANFACRRAWRRCKSAKRGHGSFSTGASDWWTPPYSIPPFSTRARANAALAQVELFETLLATLDVADDFAPSRSDRTLQAQSLIVKIAEDHALSQIRALST